MLQSGFPGHCFHSLCNRLTSENTNFPTRKFTSRSRCQMSLLSMHRVVSAPSLGPFPWLVYFLASCTLVHYIVFIWPICSLDHGWFLLFGLQVVKKIEMFSVVLFCCVRRLLRLSFPTQTQALPLRLWWTDSDTLTTTSCVLPLSVSRVKCPSLNHLLRMSAADPSLPSALSPLCVLGQLSISVIVLSLTSPAAAVVCILLNVAPTAATTWLCHHLHHEARRRPLRPVKMWSILATYPLGLLSDPLASGQLTLFPLVCLVYMLSKHVGQEIKAKTTF